MIKNYLCYLLFLLNILFSEELIDGVKMNHGKLVLVVIQRLERLNRFTKSLRKGNYYDKWSKENLDDVVNWRFED